MATNRSVIVLIVLAVPLLLAGYMVGRAAPALEADGRARESFDSLKEKLPGLVADWAKTVSGGAMKQVKTEIKIARFIGPSEAKVTLFITRTFDFGVPPRQTDTLQVSFYLRYFEGQWTTTRADWSPKSEGDELNSSLMLAIDKAGEK